ncbi:MAG TPA: sugar-binding domain-containing protein [Bacteroidales bacterium]
MKKQKRFFRSNILCLFVCVLSAMPYCDASALSESSISLAGKWQFKLDQNKMGTKEKWYNTLLTENIELPGSCEQGGYGIKATQPTVGKLTRIIKYEGKAWYQKEIEIPENWKGMRTELFLERCHWESTVWVDGTLLASQNSLSTPHIYDLGVLNPGKHILTICIDNTYKIPIGTWGHSITEDTQGNWNGIIGKIELRATGLVWIKNVQVFPTFLRVSVGNETGSPVAAKINAQSFQVPARGSVFVLPFSDQKKPWDEFAPILQTVSVNLTAGAWKDTKVVRYGMRTLETKEKQFVLNGRPVLMRGPVDECVYPLTGYPPMDKEAWLRVLRICQSYGFNFMRFHSWCPPEAAFEAGDELGFFFQIELPLWTMDAPHYGLHPLRDQFIQDELNLVLDAYGNHPSFAFMAMGNESAGTLDELTKMGREKDSRHLYRCEAGNTKETGDYLEIGQRGILGPRTDWDRWSSSPGWIAGTNTNTQNTGATIPTFAHEVGQWCMYPDLKEVRKYTGTLRALNYESYKKSLEAHHMLGQAEAFARASGKLSVLLYKDEIEASMRSYPYGGFQVLEARDYPGQGTAVVGWLDAFWDSKGLITPEEFRRFCAPTVCLLRMPKRVWSSKETFTAQAEMAHYGAQAMDISPSWKMTDVKGKVVASGALSGKRVETGRTTSLGSIQTKLSGVSKAQKLIVTVSGAGTSNSWEIWVYPDAPTRIPENVRIVHSFDKTTKEALSKGENVLLLSSPKEGIIPFNKGMMLSDELRALPEAVPGKNAITGSFMPVFWCTRLFNQIGTMGILCNPKHPVFADFPTEEYSNWQWADLLGHFTAANSLRVAGAPEQICLDMEQAGSDVSDRSKAILLDGTPADFTPLLQVIDNYDRNAKLGTIFETKVGKGKLLVCAMDLETDADKRPAARQLMQSILNYAAGKKFAPTHELSLELLDKILGN